MADELQARVLDRKDPNPSSPDRVKRRDGDQTSGATDSPIIGLKPVGTLEPKPLGTEEDIARTQTFGLCNVAAPRKELFYKDESGTTKVLHSHSTRINQIKKALLPTEKDAKDELHYYEVTSNVLNLLDGSALAEDLQNDESDITVGSMVSIISTVSEISKMSSHYTPTYVYTNSKRLYRNRNTCTRIDRLCMTPRKKKRLVGHGSARKLFLMMYNCMCALCHYRQHCCDSHANHARIQTATDAPTGDAERCKQKITDKRETVNTGVGKIDSYGSLIWKTHPP